MKITSFNPSIITKDLESVVSVFEALGFERKHNPTGTSALGNEYVSYRMTDANGFHVDVSRSSAPRERDLTTIRMNVDDFDEAYELAKQEARKRRMDVRPSCETVHYFLFLPTTPDGTLLYNSSSFAVEKNTKEVRLMHFAELVDEETVEEC